MANRITVVGSANIDLTFRAAKLPRLGATVSFVGRVGADEFGRAIREQLAREGVDVAHLLDDPDRPTGTAAILVDDAGENAIVGVPGANLGLTPEDVRAAAPLLESS